MKHSIMKALAILVVFITTAMPLSAAEVVTYYHNDHLGSPIAATDSTGSVTWQQAYDPWGLKLTTNTDERGYTGNWFDEETGLADHKARWYTSSIGRFTAIDPVKWQESSIHSFNRYAYGNNNPYGYVDSDGRSATAVVQSWVMTDTAVPDPSDLVWPKWAVYTVAVAGAATLDIVLLNEILDDSADLPDGLVGTQDSKSKQQGNRQNNGPLAPEYGGTGNAEDDFEHLTGGSNQPASENYPEGTRIGDNGITLRPSKGKDGPRIDIPAKGEKPHETLHYKD